MRILIITNKLNSNEVNANLLHLFACATDICDTAGIAISSDVLVIGENLPDFINNIAKYNIVKNILSIDSNNTLAEIIAPVIAKIAPEYTHIIIAADSFGKNLLPRIAGILEIGQISEIVKVVTPNIFQKFIYTGNVLVELESLEEIKLLTVRTNSFKITELQKTGTNEPNIIELNHNDIDSLGTKLLGIEIVDSFDLTNAKVIVTGGKSLLSKDSFDNLIRPLADKLTAGVGATRAAVDAGIAHNDCQIGQTGKTVAPNVYLAIGISGAAQHIAGMKDSKTVIAINHDENAPIFEYSDYGLVTDLFNFIPEITNKL
jgi:electron transfer flavoprotein alpha subunit